MHLPMDKAAYQPGESRQIARRMRSCFIILATIVSIYLLIVVWGLGWSLFNQLRWNWTGSSNYTMTMQNDSYAGVCPWAGTWRIPVRNGKVTEHMQFGDFTIDQLFFWTRQCAIPTPFESCSIAYDPNYGYPSKLIIRQSFPGVIGENCLSFSKIDVQIDR